MQDKHKRLCYIHFYFLVIYPMQLAYLNGEFLPLKEARISPMDRGFLYADGIYELMPVYQGKIFWFEEHFARLTRSLEQINMRNPHSKTEWLSICERLITASPSPTLSIYIQITRGVEWVRNHFYDPATEPTVFAYGSPMTERRSIDEIPLGWVITMEDIRWGHCDIKAISLLANVLAREAAHLKGATEALLIRDGKVIEGSASNLFMVKDGVIVTAPKSNFILSGIEREVILDLAKTYKVPYQEKLFTLDELYAADEVWLSSSIREIQPVIQVNDTTISEGKPGPLWRKMIGYFYELKQKLLLA